MSASGRRPALVVFDPILTVADKFVENDHATSGLDCAFEPLAESRLGGAGTQTGFVRRPLNPLARPVSRSSPNSRHTAASVGPRAFTIAKALLRVLSRATFSDLNRELDHAAQRSCSLNAR
jgi:hypothetical protein